MSVIHVEFIGEPGVKERDTIFLTPDEVCRHLCLHDMRNIRDACTRIIRDVYDRPCLGILSVSFREGEE